MPAATKGFLDRVLVKGVMFEELSDAKGNPFRNLMTNLTGVSVLSIMTTPDKAWYRDPLTKILFKGTFGKIGLKNLHWTNYASIADKTLEQREHLLHQTEQAFATLPTSAATPSRPGPQPAGSRY